MGLVFDRTVQCANCGMDFATQYSRTKYCPACAAAMGLDKKRERKREYTARERQKEREIDEEYRAALARIERNQKKKEKYKGPSLQEIMKAATAEGLQYAEYCKKHGLK